MKTFYELKEAIQQGKLYKLGGGDILPLVKALKDNISVEVRDAKKQNKTVTLETSDDGAIVKYKKGRNTQTEKVAGIMPAIKAATKFLNSKEMVYKEL